MLASFQLSIPIGTRHPYEMRSAIRSRERGGGIGALALIALSLVAGCGGPAARKARGEVAETVAASLEGGSSGFDHAEWSRLLAAGTKDGLIDYRFMQEHRGDLEAYLQRVGTTKLDELAPSHLEALLINAYNAYTVQSILDHPGVESIREITGVWTQRKHRVGGFELTLDEIEHNILRPFFRDPRIHFVVNCASRSCAPLPPWAVDGGRVDEQLEDRTRSFLRDPDNVRFESGELFLSSYFDWYGTDFISEGWHGAEPTLAAYVARYASGEIAERIRERGSEVPVSFIDYDWMLNASTPPDPDAARPR